jgi:hypothetical protein
MVLNQTQWPAKDWKLRTAKLPKAHIAELRATRQMGLYFRKLVSRKELLDIINSSNSKGFIQYLGLNWDLFEKDKGGFAELLEPSGLPGDIYILSFRQFFTASKLIPSIVMWKAQGCSDIRNYQLGRDKL